MKHQVKADFDLQKLAPAVLEHIQAAVTVIDLDGTILYYNTYAAGILDRKPEYIDRDVRGFHKDESNIKIDRIIDGFKAGSREPVEYDITRDNVVFRVTVRAFVVDEKVLGCVHTVVKKS